MCSAERIIEISKSIALNENEKSESDVKYGIAIFYIRFFVLKKAAGCAIDQSEILSE